MSPLATVAMLYFTVLGGLFAFGCFFRLGHRDDDQQNRTPPRRGTPPRPAPSPAPRPERPPVGEEDAAAWFSRLDDALAPAYAAGLIPLRRAINALEPRTTDAA